MSDQLMLVCCHHDRGADFGRLEVDNLSVIVSRAK
jgi:hypothetical protein